MGSKTPAKIVKNVGLRTIDDKDKRRASASQAIHPCLAHQAKRAIRVPGDFVDVSIMARTI
ncbi:MAG: hypothetical protein K9G60_02075 [Pseudolabrys sp.]|nr:hypothetical protein [Pseudolabrys sp.]